MTRNVGVPLYVREILINKIIEKNEEVANT